MKSGAAAFLAVISLLFAATMSHAQTGNTSVEGTLNYGTEAFDGVGSQFGATVGFGYLFLERLQGRVDVSYLRSGKSVGDGEATGSRVPIAFGLRYLQPLPKVDSDLTVFGQGGFEVSFDRRTPGGGGSSGDRTSVGALLGCGAEYALAPGFGAVANLAFHIIDDPFLSLGVGMAYHFP